MAPQRLAAGWPDLAEDAVTDNAKERAQHPTATLRELEAAINEYRRLVGAQTAARPALLASSRPQFACAHLS